MKATMRRSNSSLATFLPDAPSPQELSGQLQDHLQTASSRSFSFFFSHIEKRWGEVTPGAWGPRRWALPVCRAQRADA